MKLGGLAAIVSLLSVACAPPIPVEHTELCMDVPDDATTCPPEDEVDSDDLFSFEWCLAQVQSVYGEGEVVAYPFQTTDLESPDLWCCYPGTAQNHGC